MEAEDEGELFLHLRPVARAPQTLSMHQLQRKLKEAARKILSLCLEKEQLIEMGNRLRAELGRPEGESGTWRPWPGCRPGSGCMLGVRGRALATAFSGRPEGVQKPLL